MGSCTPASKWDRLLFETRLPFEQIQYMHSFKQPSSDLIFRNLGKQARGRDVAKGGGIWGSEPPTHWPKFLVIFTKTLAKRRLSAYPWRFRTLETPSYDNFWPQNPLLRSFLATPLARGLGHLSLPWVWKQFPSYKQNDFNPFHEKFGFLSSCGIWFIYFGAIRDL